MIRFSSDEIRFTLKEKAKIRAWIKSEVRREGVYTLTLSYVFCSDEKLLEVNKAFLNHHYFTDIITFDYSDLARNALAGEMWISIDRVLENAAEYGSSFDEELRRVMIHGVFHLLGNGDKSKEEAKKMRRLENNALARYKEEE